VPLMLQLLVASGGSGFALIDWPTDQWAPVIFWRRGGPVSARFATGSHRSR
jgi:hypothetical protein